MARDNKCPMCKIRMVQDQQTGLCRRCGRTSGRFTQTMQELDAEHVARAQAKRPKLKPIPIPSWMHALPPLPRDLTLEGITYTVVWDGRRDLEAEAAARAALRARVDHVAEIGKIKSSWGSW